MKWLIGYMYDGWSAARFAVQEMGAAIDRAMDVWDD